MGESIYRRNKTMNKSIAGMAVLHSEISISFSNVSLVVVVSKSTNSCRFYSTGPHRSDKIMSLLKLRTNGGMEFMERRFKPVFNYDLEESNRIMKRGISPIGCGVGNRDGRAYIVFMGTRQYFETKEYLQYMEKNRIN